MQLFAKDAFTNIIFVFLIIFGLVCQNWRKYLNIVRSASKWSYWIFHNMRFLFDLFHNMLNYAVNEQLQSGEVALPQPSSCCSSHSCSHLSAATAAQLLTLESSHANCSGTSQHLLYSHKLQRVFLHRTSVSKSWREKKNKREERKCQVFYLNGSVLKKKEIKSDFPFCSFCGFI